MICLLYQLPLVISQTAMVIRYAIPESHTINCDRQLQRHRRASDSTNRMVLASTAHILPYDISISCIRACLSAFFTSFIPLHHTKATSVPGISYSYATRSEEHTSELQSRPHISYAVFCLKKKKNNTQNKHMQD